MGDSSRAALEVDSDEGEGLASQASGVATWTEARAWVLWWWRQEESAE